MQAPSLNSAQIEFWNGATGERWTRLQKPIDTVFAPFKAAAIARLAPQPGERILDIGCGAGDTSLALAERVQAHGYVLGLDISRPLLRRAQARAAITPEYPVEFVLADAATHALPEASFDALFSRFGIMFFADPAAAFSNMRRALKRQGRVMFCCWRDRRENEWVRVAVEAARKHVAQLPAPPGPEEPGPFSFADEGRLRRVLSAAGFAEIAVERFDPGLEFGREPKEAAELLAQVGPVGSALQEQPESVRAAVATELASMLDGRPRPITLASSSWIVRARN